LDIGDLDAGDALKARACALCSQPFVLVKHALFAVDIIEVVVDLVANRYVKF
jgi:hypothetical protein